MIIINIIEVLKTNKYYILINNYSHDTQKKGLKLYNYLESLKFKKRFSSFFEVKTSNIQEFIKQLLEENNIKQDEKLILYDFIKQKNF